MRVLLSAVAALEGALSADHPNLLAARRNLESAERLASLNDGANRP